MGLFGPSKEEVWQELCAQIGAEYLDGGFWKGDRVQAKHGPWTITLDIYNSDETAFTRIRAPFVDPKGFSFEIYRRGIFTDLAKLFGAQDVEIGDEFFDEEFVIKASSEQRIKELLNLANLRQMISCQSNLHIKVKDNEGIFGPTFPAATSELYLVLPGIIKDVDCLKELFALVRELLEHMCRIGITTDEDPGVAL